jgi:hypothetical protein
MSKYRPVSLKEYLEKRIALGEDRINEKIDALKEFLTQRAADQDKALNLALASAKEAVTKSEVAVGERLALLNESRKTISDLNALTLSRAEYSSAQRELSSKIEAIERSLTGRVDTFEKTTIAALARSAGQQSVWISLGLAFVALAGVVLEVFRH